MSGTLAAPDQTAELEKSNEYGDTQDAKDNIAQDFAAPDEIEAVERPDRPVELEDDVLCLMKYGRCRRRYSYKFCLKKYNKCRASSVNQEDEDRPVELEEDDENGNTQDFKNNIPQDFAALDQIEAVERPDRPVEIEAVERPVDLLNWRTISSA